MIYFLSDAHLGSRAMQDPIAHQQKLVDLLLQMGEDATAIYLLGDIFDFWYEYVWPSSRRTKETLFSPTLDTLKQLTGKGIAVHFFIGNHDIWTFGWLKKRTGMTIHRRPEDLHIADKHFYMGHGDGIVPMQYLQSLPREHQRKIRHFIWLRRFFHSHLAQWTYRMLPTHWGDEIGYEWARRSRLKELAHPYPYKGETQEELVLFAKEQESLGHHHDYYIFGHRHIELDLMLSGTSRIIILGDYFQQWTYARLQDDALLPDYGQLILENYEY